MDNCVLNVTYKPPPPSEDPVQFLKKRHTAPELREILNNRKLSIKGSKDDMILRYAKSENL
jgi:hypothetical protein